MNRILIPLFFTLLSVSCLCQNYTPFNSLQPKRFQNVSLPSDNDYFFYSMETLTTNDTTIYKQYVRELPVAFNIPSEMCNSWSGPFAFSVDTTWLGRSFMFNSATNELELSNRFSEALTFDFGLSLGDSSSFYQTSTEEYFIKHTSIGQEIILGQIDLVKVFSISKYDNVGNPISSSLNSFEIKLGKGLGLIQFIDCNNFPVIETGVELMGRLNPTIGNYQLTYDEVYPWEPGDTLEAMGALPFQGGGGATVEYRLVTVLNRVETTDSVWIYLDITNWPASVFNITYPNPIVYRKGDNLVPYPHNMLLDGIVHQFDSGNHCGERKGYQNAERPVFYCDSCYCFPIYDAVGDLMLSNTYRSGLGQTRRDSQYFGTGGIGATASLIYSNIGGEVCGSYVPLGLNEQSLNVSVAPNPVNDQLKINSNFEMNLVEVLSSNAAIIISSEESGMSGNIVTTELKPGIYFLRVYGGNGNFGVSKFAKL